MYAPTSLKIAAFLVLVGTLLLWLASFSTPFIKSIYWVGLQGGHGIRYGTFGWCNNGVCLPSRVGYSWKPQIPQGSGLTGSLILLALAAGFGSLAFLALIWTIMDLNRGGLAFILTILSAFLSVLGWILSLATFVTAHHRFGSTSWGGDFDPHYGPAMWLCLVGMLLLVTAVPFVVIGWWRERHYRDREVAAATRVERRRRWF